ncbi:hypothetical protein [Streptomyces sp. NPDC005969]|uniref:hypothetical protein n=1 Tax=Streptomyces sp. NPDC005969 TaxID=3156722 RepID=UPI0033EB3821
MAVAAVAQPEVGDPGEVDDPGGLELAGAFAHLLEQPHSEQPHSTARQHRDQVDLQFVAGLVARSPEQRSGPAGHGRPGPGGRSPAASVCCC